MSKLKNINKKGKNKYQIHEEIVSQKHSSLLYMSRKTLRKEAKVVKSFECQKIVRKIKELKSSGDGDIAEKLKKFEEKLKHTKAFDLELVVQACISRCGLTQKDMTDDDDESNHDISTSNVDYDEFTAQLMNDILKHKRIVAVMQNIRVKVSEYNTWLAREEEWLAGKKHNEKKQSDKSGKSLKRNRNDYDSADNDIFIGSLANNGDELSGYGDADEEEGGNEDEGFTDFENYDDLQMTKKNRMGQRQRKARAKAIEAANKGKVLGKDQSLNWRPKKQKRDDSHKEKSKVESASGLDISKNVQVAEVANMGKNWKDEGKAHPSWAAREAQKTKSGLGIVEFKGKKITFD